MNYEEIKTNIIEELKNSYNDLADVENTLHFQSIGVDIQSEMDRYSALIDAFEIIVKQAQTWNDVMSELDEVDRDKIQFRLSQDAVLISKGTVVEIRKKYYDASR